MVNKVIGNCPHYQREESRNMNLMGIDPSDKNLVRERKSSMPDHAFRISTCQYEVLRMNEDHGMV